MLFDISYPISYLEHFFEIGYSYPPNSLKSNIHTLKQIWSRFRHRNYSIGLHPHGQIHHAMRQKRRRMNWVVAMRSDASTQIWNLQGWGRQILEGEAGGWVIRLEGGWSIDKASSPLIDRPLPVPVRDRNPIIHGTCSWDLGVISQTQTIGSWCRLQIMCHTLAKRELLGVYSQPAALSFKVSAIVRCAQEWKCTSVQLQNPHTHPTWSFSWRRS
jgi:hypothetical protein